MEKDQGTASELARGLAAMRRRVVKQCEVCGKEFEGIKTARYCSNACLQKASYERNGPQRRAAALRKYHAKREQQQQDKQREELRAALRLAYQVEGADIPCIGCQRRVPLDVAVSEGWQPGTHSVRITDKLLTRPTAVCNECQAKGHPLHTMFRSGYRPNGFHPPKTP